MHYLNTATTYQVNKLRKPSLVPIQLEFFPCFAFRYVDKSSWQTDLHFVSNGIREARKDNKDLQFESEEGTRRRNCWFFFQCTSFISGLILPSNLTD